MITRLIWELSLIQMLTGKGAQSLRSFSMHILYFLITYISPRSAAVDSAGRELNRNRLIALMSAIVLEEVSYLDLALHITVAFYILNRVHLVVFFF